MTLTTHHVVGVLEWPAGADLPVEMLDCAQPDESGHRGESPQVWSLRIPHAESTCSTPANLGQLRVDLQRLFEEFAR